VASIVIPFRGSNGKRRLEPAPEDARAALALAMLGDVLEASVAVGDTIVATEDAAAEELAVELGVASFHDPGAGQGAAVAEALRSLDGGPVLVVNADVPCARPRDLLTLLGAIPPGGIALVRAADGTTNALALATPGLYAPLYGPRSERRLREHAARIGVASALADIPNLAEDVDTLADLERLGARVGRRTQDALRSLHAALPQ